MFQMFMIYTNLCMFFLLHQLFHGSFCMRTHGNGTHRQAQRHAWFFRSPKSTPWTAIYNPRHFWQCQSKKELLKQESESTGGAPHFVIKIVIPQLDRKTSNKWNVGWKKSDRLHHASVGSNPQGKTTGHHDICLAAQNHRFLSLQHI